MNLECMGDDPRPIPEISYNGISNIDIRGTGALYDENLQQTGP